MSQGIALLRNAAGVHVKGSELDIHPAHAGAFVGVCVVGFVLPALILSNRISMWSVLTDLAFAICLIAGLLLSKSDDFWPPAMISSGLYAVAYSQIFIFRLDWDFLDAIWPALKAFPAMLAFYCGIALMAKIKMPRVHDAVAPGWLNLAAGIFVGYLAYLLAFPIAHALIEESTPHFYYKWHRLAIDLALISALIAGGLLAVHRFVPGSRMR